MKYQDPGDQKTRPESVDPAQGGLSDTAPAPVHAEPHDTEVQAAAKVATIVGGLRRDVLALVTDAGSHGVTAWEAIVALGMEDSEWSVRPRFAELMKDRFGNVMKVSKHRRPNGRGNNEVAYVINPQHRSDIEINWIKEQGTLLDESITPEDETDWNL